jgi:uncharacterized protein YidB (DUF937 family)
MGLMDILNGMQHGPGGVPGGARSAPPPSSSSGGGILSSPILTALLGLLAYKAVQGGGLGNILGRGQQTPQTPPSGGGTGGGGLGDILGGMFGGNAGGAPQGKPGYGGNYQGGGSQGGPPPSGGGGLGSILGGMFGGAAASSVLNGGLGQIINDLQRAGQGRTAQSWISTGQNEPIEPDQLERALGADTLDQLSRDTGMPRDQLREELSEKLPQLVDQLTPEGRLPTDAEAAAKW